MPIRPIPFGHALRLRIELQHVRPVVWRTVMVADYISLGGLHHILQGAFGWQNCHLYEFRAGERRWARPDPEFDPPGTVGKLLTRLTRALPSDGRLDYTYDFGDGWEHVIQLQGTEPYPWQKLPRCIAGANACPPEDCGGPSGYEELRRILADKDDPEHAAMRKWVGKKFDPAAFSLIVANRRMRLGY